MTCPVGPRLFALATLLVAITAPPAHAAGHDLTADFRTLHVRFHPLAEPPASPIGPIDFLSGADRAISPIDQVPAVAFEYSDAYHRRATVHRVASIAMIPLLVTQGILGKEIYEDPTSGKRTAHQVVAGAIGGLFAVNTVTGVWNLVEGRKDPNKRGLRVTHGLLMLGADVGFLATALQAPSTEGTEGSRTTHRALAITSICVATTGYLIMLFGNR